MPSLMKEYLPEDWMVGAHSKVPSLFMPLQHSRPSCNQDLAVVWEERESYQRKKASPELCFLFVSLS